MKLSPSSEAASCAAIQEFPNVLQNPKVHYHDSQEPSTGLYPESDQSIPPLWSTSQSSWLQIRKPGFDSRHYQKKKVVVLEWGPLSLVSTTEKLLDRKIAAPV
jgi:hypothetical protein